ncbi:MAG: MTAP family purine nucleoside phosphorylase [archaeon]
MTTVGIIGGTVFFEVDLLKESTVRTVNTPYGQVDVYEQGDIRFIQRHGKDHVPPHAINYRANIAAFSECGVTHIIGAYSVGGMHMKYSPGTILVPHDFIHLGSTSTIHDRKSVHITPALDEGLREALVSGGKAIVDRGVYWNTPGPRLETKAEITMISGHADVVGMTMAHEATLANEFEIPFAAICSVDNFAHGVGDKQMTYEEIKKMAKKNAGSVASVIRSTVERL